MRAVLQRVNKAELLINGKVHADIGLGLVVLLGIEENDDQNDVQWLSKKISAMRIFSDENKLMNLSVLDLSGDILLVSQFTLHAATKKGNRPSFIKAAKPSIAEPLYQMMIRQLSENLGKPVKTGVFGEDMEISLVNDGPVTILIDSKNEI